MKICLLALFALLASTSSRGRADEPAAAGASSHGQLQSGGRTREYELFLPANSKGAPLVVALHGHFGAGAQLERSSKLDLVAARERFAVVYPDGIKRGWDDGRAGVNEKVDDVGFISALIDDLLQRYHLDPKRVFVTGMSNGAIMSYRLACDLAGKIRAIAPVAGNIPDDIVCKPAAKVSVLAINGDADPLVPYNGGAVGRDRGKVKSAADSTQLFATANGCGLASDAAPAKLDLDRAPDDGTHVKTLRYPKCPPGIDVELVTIVGGGHGWPGDKQYLAIRFVGTVSQQLDASDLIGQFFTAHSK